MAKPPTKAQLRKALREERRAHVKAQDSSIRALLFHRPPRPLLAKIGPSVTIGLYSETSGEAPASGYAQFFHEEGHPIALPHFSGAEAQMTFREHTDPLGQSDLEPGPFRIDQPGDDAQEIIPDVVFVPLVGFTERLDRLGQGGGHYDRWLAEHPGRMTIGLAWDVQLVPELETEAHDIALDAVVTPTRIYGLN